MAPAAETALIIATGANQRYWQCLCQFLGNVKAKGLHRAHRFTAYDLGLEPSALERLKRDYPWCEFRRFAFENYPPHVAMNAGSYAFKPLIVAELMESATGPVFWFDSATLFRTRDLSFLGANVRRDGVYALRGQTPLEGRCDPDVLASLDVPFFIRCKPELAAGAIGFDAGKPGVQALVREWAEHALVKDHIAPRIPRLSFHRPEQALLTWLVYREQDKGTLGLTGEEIDISSAWPIRWMSSRNFVPPDTPAWAGPLLRLYYAGYKMVDRTLWRLKRLRATRFDGLHRKLKEHFTVLLRDAAGKVWRLPTPSWCYYADPFLTRHQGRLALLLERFDYRINKGGLCALELDDELRAGPAIAILPGRGHASFPAIFRYDGRLYLVPETCQDRTVEIHLCEEFPFSWRRVRTVLENIDAADSIIFPHDGYWWLITAVRGLTSGRHLEIYFTRDMLEGEWQAHPVNGRRLYQDEPCSSGRNGGAIIAQDGLLLRPAQKSHRFYGEGLQLMRIEVLTPQDYRESPYQGSHPARTLIEDFSPHHLCIEGELAAFDIRDRARRAEGLWPFGLKRRPQPQGDIPNQPPHAKVASPEADLGSD